MRTLAWLCGASILLGFSGSGKESYQEALKYLGYSRRMTPEEAQAMDQMSKTDRLTKAIDLLTDAYNNAGSDQETKETTALLGKTYNKRAIEYADQKDYRDAVFDAQQSLKYLPADWVVMNNLGEFQVAGGDYDGAAQSFASARDAAKSDSDKQAVERKLILVYQKEGEAGTLTAFDDAIGAIESLPNYDQDFDLLLQLGETYNLKGDAAKALAAWDKAQAIHDLPGGIAQKYKNLQAAQQIKSDKGFTRERAQHFTVDFQDKGNSSQSDKFLGFLDDAWSDVGLKFNLFPKQTFFVTIYMSTDYDAAVAIPWSAAVAQQNHIDIRVRPGEPDNRYRDVIRHEYTHILVWLTSGQRLVPTWFNEGLAMHSEEHLDLTPFTSLLDLALKKKHKYIPFEKLENGFTSLPNEKYVRLAYAQGYSIVDRMIERFGFNSMLKILQTIAGGEDFRGAFESVTTVRWHDFEKEWFEQASGGSAGPEFTGIEVGSHPASAATSPAGAGPGAR